MKTAIMLAAALTVLSLAAPAAAAPRSRDFEAGPIWNQQDAEVKCPIVASAVRGRWNGNWVTTRWNEMSVCGVEGARRFALRRETPVEVGPIWNQDDAQLKCPVAAAALRAVWNGHWWTTREGQMSVCALIPRV